MSADVKSKLISRTFRLEKKLVEQMERARTDAWPFNPSLTAIVARGIQLAIAEMKSQRRRRKYDA